MDVTMTALQKPPIPEDEPPPQRQLPPVQEEVYYEQQRDPSFQDWYGDSPVQETLPQFPFDKHTIIVICAAFFIGFLIGSLRRPIIIRGT
jgi:hypothetical protein